MFGLPPWFMTNQQGQGANQMTRAPMNMNPVQFGQPSSIPAAPPIAQPQQQPINPAQMGMLSQMLAQNTQKPGAAAPPSWRQISPQAMEGVIPGMSGADTHAYMQNLAPDPGVMGMLSKWLGWHG